MNNVAEAKIATKNQGPGVKRLPSPPTTIELAVVVTVMLTTVVEVMEVGLKEHAERAGSPLQLKLTVPAA
jgi:hypothetical protein